jgi:hypothetical protein
MEAFCCLRGRSVPSGLLDGVADAVESHAPFVPVGGGMSLAFLDTPRSLRLWRTTAVAAGLLLAVGVGLVASGHVGTAPRRPSPVPLNDARGALLEDLDVAARPRALTSGAVQPASWPAHRSGQLFFWMPRPPREPAEGAGAAPRWD